MAATDHVQILRSATKDCIELISTLIDSTKSLDRKNNLSRRYLQALGEKFAEQVDHLKTWRKDVKPPEGGHEPPNFFKLISTAQDCVSLIEARIKEIEAFLKDADSRELPQTEIGAWQLSIDTRTDKVDDYIQQVEGRLADLQPSNLSKRINQVTHDVRVLEIEFINKIKEIPREDRIQSFRTRSRRCNIRFESLAWFWRPIRKPVGKRVQPGEPGDGFVINDFYLYVARRVLKTFKDAWRQVAQEDGMAGVIDDIALDNLVKMPKIAAVLHVANTRHLLSEFIEHEKTDEDMDQDPARVVSVLRNRQDSDFIKAQYSRANQKPWDDGHTLKLELDEPLPLVVVDTYTGQQGSYIERVQDAWDTKRVYVRKFVVKDRLHADLDSQFENEIQCLQELSKENHGHHIVRLVKSYERGNERGILIQPVADDNLRRLLRTCCSSRSRTSHRESLLRAFGCLAYSLCYLHNIKMFRHRDVKPHNILYLKRQDGSAQFIWSDFGLTYDFSERFRELGSGTADARFRATPQYEAPEINNPGARHGRSADVFGLGCIYMEIASVLLIPANVSLRDIELCQYYNYKDHIRELDDWAQGTINRLRNDRSNRFLRKVLEMAREMIARDPTKRPKIGEIAMKLGDIALSNDQTAYSFCDDCYAKYRRDRSGNPDHKGIFNWKPSIWRQTLAPFASLRA